MKSFIVSEETLKTCYSLLGQNRTQENTKALGEVAYLLGQKPEKYQSQMSLDDVQDRLIQFHDARGY